MELLEAQLAEKEQRLRALGEKLETAKEQPEPAPEPAPEPPPPQRAPTPPVEPEEVYDMPLHPAASAESLGRHLARFCQRGSTLVSRDGLIQALQSLPDTDRAKRMVHKVLRIFDRPDFVDEGGYGSTDIHQKLVSAHAAADLTKLIVLLAHGEHREHVNFALSAVNAPKGLPPAVSSELAKKALDVAGTYRLTCSFCCSLLTVLRDIVLLAHCVGCCVSINSDDVWRRPGRSSRPGGDRRCH